MKQTKIKQNSVNFQIENRLSVQKPVFRKNPHYPISNLFLIVLLYIVEAKKGCKKKSLNILSLAAYLLKLYVTHIIYKTVLSKTEN